MSGAPDIAVHPTRILIVDDQRHNRQLLEIMLAAEGYRLDEASSGEEALARIAQQPPDLILLSARDPHVNKERALKAGARAYLQKPWNDDELLGTIRSLLGDTVAAPQRP